MNTLSESICNNMWLIIFDVINKNITPKIWNAVWDNLDHQIYFDTTRQFKLQIQNKLKDSIDNKNEQDN